MNNATLAEIFFSIVSILVFLVVLVFSNSSIPKLSLLVKEFKKRSFGGALIEIMRIIGLPAFALVVVLSAMIVLFCFYLIIEIIILII